MKVSFGIPYYKCKESGWWLYSKIYQPRKNAQNFPKWQRQRGVVRSDDSNLNCWYVFFDVPSGEVFCVFFVGNKKYKQQPCSCWMSLGKRNAFWVTMIGVVVPTKWQRYQYLSKWECSPKTGWEPKHPLYFRYLNFVCVLFVNLGTLSQHPGRLQSQSFHIQGPSDSFHCRVFLKTIAAENWVVKACFGPVLRLSF